MLCTVCNTKVIKTLRRQRREWTDIIWRHMNTIIVTQQFLRLCIPSGIRANLGNLHFNIKNNDYRDFP